jgi:hypothetical protein
VPLPTLHDHYSVEEFRCLIANEGDRIELKTGTSSKPLQEALVAFSNTDGGLLFMESTTTVRSSDANWIRARKSRYTEWRP